MKVLRQVLAGPVWSLPTEKMGAGLGGKVRVKGNPGHVRLYWPL